MEFDFNTLPNRRANESVKWNKYNEDVLPMWVAEMDFKTPGPVIEALKARVDHGVFGYPQFPKNLEDSVIEWLARRHGWQACP